MIHYSSGKVRDRDGIKDFIVEHCPAWNFDENSFEFIRKWMLNLKEGLTFFLEYPYVDLVYRDNYYEYFSSKHRPFDRNCLRIVLFSHDFNLPSLLSADKDTLETIRKAFLGFLIIRPTARRPIARSVISPKALLKKDFEIVLSKHTIEFFGLKLSVTGFPHISQDSEVITCAESSLWTLLEYYSHKYHEYNPVLPSKLRKIIRSSSVRRMIPSTGLTIAEISYAINELGFSAIVYQRKEEEHDSIKDEIYTYVESGIPVILGLDDGEKFRHAIVCIGHTEVNLGCELKNQQDFSDKIFNISSIQRNFITMDDNLFPYSRIDPNQLSLVYKEKPKAKIKYAVVPLNKRIYMDSFMARSFIMKLLTKFKEVKDTAEQICMRFFLTSSRSFKQAFISGNSFAPKNLKKLVLHSSFPKFIWIAELGFVSDFSQNQGRGLLILDATGSNSKESVLFYYFDGTVRTPISLKAESRIKVEDSLLFSLYKNNLKGNWNDWET